MVQYFCDRCGKEFYHKSAYTKHINKKFSCIKVVLNDNHVYVCNVCGYSTDVKCNLTKHQNRKNPCEPGEYNNETTLSNDDTEMFKKELADLCNKYNIPNIPDMKDIPNIKNINNGTIINCSNSTVNVITINPFGQEDLSHIDNKKARRILNNGLLAVSKYIEYVHYDENTPQNHNVYIGGWNNRANVNVYDGKKWVVIGKEDVIAQVIDNCMDFINDKIDELDKNNPDDEKIFIMANRLKTAYDDNDVSKLKCVAREIQRTLYNNKGIPKQTMKKQKQLTDKLS